MKREWVRTADQSQTLWVPELQQHYHSHHGALQESRHVFIKAGLAELAASVEINLLEVGFGTGLNALLTALEPINPEQVVHYHSLEKYPLDSEEWQGMDLPSFLPEHQSASTLFNKIHQSAWQEEVPIQKGFFLFKDQVDLKSFAAPKNHFDLIYFDAFSPGAQEDLWTETVFAKMQECLKPGGILVTYCVMGKVRRAMQAAGLRVTKIPGPPGKREMVRAYKD